MLSYQFTVMVFASAMFLINYAEATPFMGSCGANNQCGPSTCCLVGYARYSIPGCSPLGDVGSWCRISDLPREMRLSYPTGVYVHLQEAYFGMCPCRPGLVCSRTSSTCQLPEFSSEEELLLNNLID
ncbi:hypothetical protein SK128_021682 [Halocaridina rubra]|uniref:Prokineticin domain-containing protein n=1 Tax=Halocaridina rubra TaxID=373956 RepID=A0AAN8X1W2_HALRR